MSANPHANGGVLLRDLVLPDFRDYAVDVPQPGTTLSEATRVLGAYLRDVIRGNPETFRLFGPGRDRLEPAGHGLRGDQPRLGRRDGARRRPSRPGRARGRGPVRASVPGVARGVPVDRPARPLQLLRGVHPHHRLDVQPAREVAEDDAVDPVARADRLAQLPALVTRLAAGPQRLLPPGPGLHRPRGEQEGRGHPRLPAARCEHAALGRRPLPAEPPVRQRDRRRQAACPELPLDGGRDPALHPRDRDLGMGLERRRRSRRGHGVLRRHPDARDARSGLDPARGTAGR